MARSLYDDGHPAVSESLVHVAYALASLGEIDEAIGLQREATDQIDDYFGPSSFPSYRFHSDLTNLLGIAGDFDEGTDEAEFVEALAESLFGADDARTIEARRIASAYRQRRGR